MMQTTEKYPRGVVRGDAVSSIADGHVHIQSECHNLNIACSKDALDGILSSIEVV